MLPAQEETHVCMTNIHILQDFLYPFPGLIWGGVGEAKFFYHPLFCVFDIAIKFGTLGSLDWPRSDQILLQNSKVAFQLFFGEAQHKGRCNEYAQ